MTTEKTGPEYKHSRKTSVSKGDVQSVADKLEGFVKELPEQERDVLGWILTRAQAAPQSELSAAAAQAARDVPGLNTPLATQLARSVGFGGGPSASEVTVVVGWQFRF